MSLGIMAPIDAGRGMQFGQVGADEVDLISQVGFSLEDFVQLFFQQLPMNRHRAEALAVLVIQVVDDQLDQIRIIGSPQSLQQMASAIGR